MWLIGRCVFYYWNTKFLKCRIGFKVDVLSSSLPFKNFLYENSDVILLFLLKVNPQ